MNENFLHYIWQYQLFDKKNLRSTQGEPIIIHKQGILNTNSGPDFTNAHIEIDGQLWVGTVEIHQKTSEWYQHGHQNDIHYNNVILHVVWEDDSLIINPDEKPLTTLILKGIVPYYLLENYSKINLKNPLFVPCEKIISKVSTPTWNHFSERLYIERLERKSKVTDELLLKTNNDWEWVAMQLIFKSFGGKINGLSFLEIAKHIPIKVLRNESTETLRLEALFLGIAGLLRGEHQDYYFKELQQIFQYQQHKYQLTEISSSPQFFRLRPPNFPNIRLVQLAQFFNNHHNWFQLLVNSDDISNINGLFKLNVTPYWLTHYVFDKTHSFKNKPLTPVGIYLIIVNAIIPLQFSYQKYLSKDTPEHLITWLNSIEAEHNSIVTRFSNLGLPIKNMLHSQAVLTLKDTYCEPKKCLQCEVGLDLLKNQSFIKSAQNT